MTSETVGARLQRRRVDANGLMFECLHSGEGDRPALCLHGFPDSAGSMNPIIWRLADAGFTARAVHARVRADRSRAKRRLLRRRARTGRDRTRRRARRGVRHRERRPHRSRSGAAAAYAAERIDSEAFPKLVTLGVPPGFEPPLFEHLRQALRSWFMWFFQLPDVPERALRWRNFALIEFLGGTWGPGGTTPTHGSTTSKRRSAPREPSRTPSSTIAIRCARRSRGSGRIARRSRTCRRSERRRSSSMASATAVSRRNRSNAREIVEECRIGRVPDAGHFAHQERPDAVGDEIVAFLE